MYGLLLDVNVDSKMCKMDIEEVVMYELARLDIFNYNIEVIKTIAVLKRSELSKRLKNSNSYIPSKNEVATTSKDFNNLSEEKRSLLKSALDDTTGIIVVSGDKAVDLYFTRCCGGGTANSEDVFNYKVNYLRKILCRYCNNSYIEKTVKISDIAQKLNIVKASFKESIDEVLKDVIRDETGRILRINFLGKEISGEEFIRQFDVRSNRVYFSEDSITLKVIGDGVGLGVCLAGADKLARDGLKYKEIVSYYYTGVEFKSLDRESILKLLAGKKVVIDPGHGGRDKGNVSKDIIEKDVNLRIALYIEKMLKYIGANVVLTRIDDSDVSSEERVKIINKERPDFCLSIHQNSFMMPGMNGIEVYCYDKDEEAMKLGKLVCSNVNTMVGIKNRGVRTGDYYLLRESRVSTLIIECMYLTGNIDMEKFNEENYLLISRSIFDSICKYYNVEPQE
jgi:stage II sporulation protein D